MGRERRRVKMRPERGRGGAKRGGVERGGLGGDGIIGQSPRLGRRIVLHFKIELHRHGR